MEVVTEKDENQQEDEPRKGIFKRLGNRLLTTLAVTNSHRKSSTIDHLRNLFSFPKTKDHEDQNLKIIRAADIPVIWILGGPGAPIQAFVDRLAKVYQFHHVSVGQILKQEIIAATGREEMVHKLMHRGVVIPRQFLNEIIMRDMADAIEIRQVRGFLFSDYPTTFVQARKFLKKVQKVDYIISFKFDENTMKLCAFHVLKRQSMSSKSLRKTKEELRIVAEKQVKKYGKELSLLYKLCGKKMKIIDGQMLISSVYSEMMKWIERAMVIHNMMPPFLPALPVKAKRFGSGGSAYSEDFI